MEVLVEELMDLHSSSSTFREIFESHQTTQLFVDAYKAFVTKAAASEVSSRVIRLLEKLGHFGMALALDNSVAGSHKREVSLGWFSTSLESTDLRSTDLGYNTNCGSYDVEPFSWEDAY